MPCWMNLSKLDWPEKSLESLADIVSGITKGRKTTETELIEVPYMAVSNVKSGYIDWTTVKTILATKQEIEQYRLMPDDILMTEGGDPDKVGGVAIIKITFSVCDLIRANFCPLTLLNICNIKKQSVTFWVAPNRQQVLQVSICASSERYLS